MALPLFAVTLFVSAFLLFLVQPMIGKMILPKLGGTPQVWNTCMLFFQCILLAGYAYTHFMSTWLTTRRQLVVHGLLLLVPIVFLVNPFNVTGWTPNPAGSAVLQALVELAVIVGIPFFVVSTSAPLLQRWFTTTGHPAAKDPYFLYGASNLGSLLSLLFYPFLMEPWIALRAQALTWAGGYIVLLILVLVCVAMVWKTAPALRFAGASAAPELPPLELADVPPPPAPAPPPATAVRAGPAPGAAQQRGIQRKKGLKVPVRTSAAAAAPSMLAEISRPTEAPVTWWRRTRWVLLAMVPSSLMLGVTTYISVDVSPFPLVWAVPLALYLLSFILVYMKWPIPWTYSETGSYTPHSLIMFFLQPAGILVMCWILLQHGFEPMYMFVAWGVFFTTALACHGELARDRPNPKHLTEYFLLMSIGGALGGFFNAIVAPAMFDGIWEFYITLCLACFVRPVLLPINWLDNWLMDQFPGLQSWARDQSDQLSRSFGKPADGSTYVLSYTLDVLLGFFVLALCWFLRNQAEEWGWFTHLRAAKVLMFFGVSERTVVQSDLHLKLYRIVLWGLPLLCCFFFAARPIRFGLGVTAILSYWLVFAGGRDDTTLFQGRTYFGVLRVLKDKEALVYQVRIQDKIQELPKDQEEYDNFAYAPNDTKRTDPQDVYNYTYLMHGTTYHGRNYIYTPGEDKVDLSRLATTYYHRYGPVGVVMEKYNWLPGPQNSFWGDARMPATMVGHIASTLGTGTMPLANLANVWTEPPYATIGLGTGTMASYSRAYQHMVYYEIDEQIRKFSLPPSGPYRFTYLRGAIKRGVNIEVIMGDARLSMHNEDPKVALYPRYQTDSRLGTSDGDSENPLLDGPKIGVMSLKDPATDQMVEKSPRERYYKVIVVDAFSSDAIPIHLCTLEAIDLYLHKLAPDGVLCMHTSNRHMNLVRPIAKIVEALDQKYQSKEFENDPLYKFRVKCKYGQDDPLRPEGSPPGGDRSKFLGQFGSNYVMIYHDEKYLKPPEDYTTLYHNGVEMEKYNIFDKIYDYKNPRTDRMEKKARSNVSWGAAHARDSDAPWTDDYSNIVSIIRWPDWLVRRSADD